MEAAGVSELDVATRRIVGGNDSPPELDSPCQEDVGEFGLAGGCCGEELRGETPGREDSPTDLREAAPDPGGDAKTPDEKAFGKEVILLMHALNSLATPEEKLAALCKKYADLLEESRCIQKQVRVLQKKQSQIVKEKLQLQGEHSKAILARSKLESLCRELQRHNKTLKEENSQRSREYDEQRKEAMQHFQVTLNDIELQMEQHSSHNGMLRQENVELADRLQKLIEQYELCEEHIDKVFKHKELQQQLMDAKLQRITELTREVEEKQRREREFLLDDATVSRHRCELMKEQEMQLKQQLSLYMDKFEEFQTTLAKSNEVFTTFRQEMEKMTKKIKKLEKETTQWRTKWESNNQALLQMAEEKTLRDGHFKALQGKLELLERLCRALQKERNDLNTRIGVLREHGGGEGAQPNPKDGPDPNPEVGPDPTPEVSPDPNPEVSPDPNPKVGPDPSPEASPDPSPEASPDPNPKVGPDPSPEASPDPSPEASPDPNPEVSPDPNPEVSPDPNPKVCPDPSPEASPDPSPKVGPDPSPEASPDPSPKVGPDPNPEAGPDPSPEVSPDPSPEASPDPSPKAGPDPNPKVGPDPSPKAGPDPNPEAGPDPSPEAGPDPNPTAVPDPNPEAGPDPNPEVGPDPSPEASPDPSPEASPDPNPEAGPEASPEARLAEPSRVPGKNSAPRDTLETQTPGHEQDDGEGEKKEKVSCLTSGPLELEEPGVGIHGHSG